MRGAAVLLPALVLGLAACRTAHPAPTAPAPPPGAAGPRLDLGDLAGDWRWLHLTDNATTAVLERERWHFDAVTVDDATGAAVALGRYRRDVGTVALDGRPFLCNQEPSYLLSALYQLRAHVEDGAIVVDETDYRTADSPCEPGIRTTGRYTVTRVPGGLHLAWDGGDETLEPTDAAALDLPPPADAAHAAAGAWHWSLRSRDAEGYARAESEDWELAVGDDGIVGGTYVRTVTTYSEDGSAIPCAGAPSWRYVDRYTVRGHLDDDGLHLEDAAVDAGQHACLAPTPTRHLDSATGQVVGDYLVLTWRGKRRQVLHR